MCGKLYSLAMNELHPLTVSQLTQAVKFSLETSFPHIYLQGEVSNLRRQASGHWYFSLKDAEAQISAVLFRGDASGLQPPKDGDLVLVKGSLNVYPPKGNYQIIVRELSLLGLGALLLKLEQLKAKLQKKGYFNPERKKPLPLFPKIIGVVTSPTGAAFQDICQVLTRRQSGFHLRLNPVRVQGEGAAVEIAQAIDQMNQHRLADVLIVGRGGGSIEDLWPFNEEIVADAIFRSQIPIISAVGHETDHCLADEVADLRAPTPSAAAEMVMKARSQHLETLQGIQRRLKQSLSHLLSLHRQRLSGIMHHPLFAQPFALLGLWWQRCDDLRNRLDERWQRQYREWKLRLQGCQRQLMALNPSTQLKATQNRLAQLQRGLDAAMQTTKQQAEQRLKHLKVTLAAINPKNLLTKGYAILFSEKEGSVITSVQALSLEKKVKILLSDGKAQATITGIDSHEPS